MSNRQSETAIGIGLAEPGDAQTIAAVLREAFEEYRHLYTLEAYNATTPSGEQIEKRIEDLEGPVWIAVRGDTVVGTVSVVPREGGLYVRSMAVLPSARGGGAGVLMLRTVESYARAHNHSRMFLSTTPFLDRAIRLYEKFGFAPSSEGPHDLFGTPLFTMVKTLEPLP